VRLSALRTCSLSDNVAPAPAFRLKTGIDKLLLRISITREAWPRRARKMQAEFRVPKPPVTLRPATEADFITMFGKPPQHRARALAAEIEGRLVGLGGITLLTPHQTSACETWACDTWACETWACETWACFMRASDELRAHPVALHRAGLRMLAIADRLGIARLVALAEPGIEAAERWLVRCGFVPEAVNGAIVFVRNRGDWI
jgi:hypothetical protein